MATHKQKISAIPKRLRKILQRRGYVKASEFAEVTEQSGTRIYSLMASGEVPAENVSRTRRARWRMYEQHLIEYFNPLPRPQAPEPGCVYDDDLRFIGDEAS